MKKGFTLIELLVVVLIIGILSAVALPQYQKAVWKSRASQLYVSAKSLATAQEVYYLANGNWAKSFSDLDLSFDNLQASSSSSLGVYIPSTDAVRYKDKFELIIAESSQFSFSAALFIEGDYKGAGFVFSHREGSGNMQGKLYCQEPVSMETGSFCHRIFATSTTPVLTNYGIRYYDL